MNEFDLIRRYFTFSSAGGQASPDTRPDLVLGVGDDCALLNVPAGGQLAVTTDTLVSGVHFPADGNAGLIARRALRVNLSDLAAMGATALGFQLALTLPALDEAWLADFSAGLAEDAAHFRCPLVGGDTTRGPLSLTLTLLGWVGDECALRRGGARAGDVVCVSGSLGDAAAALAGLEARAAGDALWRRYWLPEPRLALGAVLGASASAGLDISDGLLQDLGHIARASGLGAEVDLARLPLSAALLAGRDEQDARLLALTGGDDYELCFTASPDALPSIETRAAALGCPVTAIGRMVAQMEGAPPVVCLDNGGRPLTIEHAGYDHFHG